MKILLMFQLSSRVLQDIDVITVSSSTRQGDLLFISNSLFLSLESTKIILADDALDNPSHTPYLSSMIHQIFRAIQTTYLSYRSNPFHLLTPSPTSSSNSDQSLDSKPIKSKLFDDTIDKIVGLKR